MLAPDTLIHDRYRIVRAIGKGGMGAVYEAFDLRLQSPVALKQMIVEGEHLSRAFAREAQLLASLRHQALPRVIDHFVDEHGQFLVMEFIPGEDLATLLQKQGAPFPVDQVLAWADTLLDVLSYLHAQQPPVIHRDIKPQNMKRTPRGEIILLDFGLAKGAAATQTRSMTGSVFGYTPQYAPLEQIKGVGTEPRSDLYALAATLYHLMTGTPPPDALTRAAAVVTHDPDPLEPAHHLNPGVPHDVSAILNQALALDPTARFANADAMRRALRQARGLSALPPVSDPTLVVGQLPAASQARPVQRSSAGTSTIPSGALRSPEPSAASPAVQRRGLGICGVLGIITLAIAIVAVVGTVFIMRQIGEGVQQGIGQVLERVSEVAPTVVAAQQTLEAGATQTAGFIEEQATTLAPALESAQQTAIAAATTVAEDAPLPPGEGRPDTSVPYRLNEIIRGEIADPQTRLGYDFVIETPQQVFIETHRYDRGMEQVRIALIGPGGGRLLNTCLGCGDPGLLSLRRPGIYTLIIGGRTNAGTGMFEVQIYDVPSPQRFAITLDAGIGAGRPESDAGQIVSPGAHQEYVFEGRPGQTIFVVVRRRDQALGQVKIKLIDPIGGEVFSTCLGCGNPGAHTLQRSGQYTLVVGSERDAATGAYELGVYDLPPPREFTIDIDAVIDGDQPAPGAGRIETPGAKNVYLFEAQAGQKIIVTVSRRDPAVGQLTMTLRAPSGAEVFSTCLGCGDPGEQTLPETGVYRLIVGSDKNEGVGAFELRIAPAP
jgi:hypothetical protein